MNIHIFEDTDLLADAAADLILKTVATKPNATLCLAAGDTPLRTYQAVVEKSKKNAIDFSNVQFVALDEWVGIDPLNSGSCQYFLKQSLFNPLQINPINQHFFNALATDVENECELMNTFIANAGGIDLMLVGVGMNGHIGFNEPGVSPNLYAHVITLDETTQRVGQKYFNESTQLKHGITLGLRHFMESKTAIMIANGQRKAEIIKQTLESPIDIQIPSSIIRNHTNGTVMIDKEAAGLLSNKA